jgi:hypothetical protein
MAFANNITLIMTAEEVPFLAGMNESIGEMNMKMKIPEDTGQKQR